MKKLFLLITVVLLTGCIQIQGIMLSNKTNERIKLYCYYDVNDFVDSVYIDRADSAYLKFYSGWFANSRKVIKNHVNHMDSIILVLQDKKIAYKDSLCINRFLLNNKDTASILNTNIYPSRKRR